MEIALYSIAAPASTSASARMQERRSRAIEFYRRESEPNCISERNSSSTEKPHRLDGEYRGQCSRRGEATPQLPEAIAFDGLQVSDRKVAGACQSEGASWSRRDKRAPTEADAPQRTSVSSLLWRLVAGCGVPALGLIDLACIAFRQNTVTRLGVSALLLTHFG